MNDVVQTIDNISKVPFQMMSNFSSSFALLLECRIHSYGNSVKRNIEKLYKNFPNGPNDKIGYYNALTRLAVVKLESLAAVAENIEVRGVVIAFNVNEKEKFDEYHILQMPKVSNTASSSEDWCDDKDITAIALPITFEANVEIAIPRYCGEPQNNEERVWKSDKFSVTIQTSGTIMGYYKEGSYSILEKVDVQLDTKTLISEMICKSGEVLKKASQNADDAISKLSNLNCERSDMNKKDCPSLTRRLSSQSASTAPNSCAIQSKNSVSNLTTYGHVKIVSPSLSPRHSPMTIPSDITLDAAALEQANSPQPSIIGGNEDCAAAVEYPIGDLDPTSTTSTRDNSTL